MQVGALYRCSKQGLSKEEATERLHDRGTLQAILEGTDPASAMPQEDREALRLYLEASMTASDQIVGSQVWAGSCVSRWRVWASGLGVSGAAGWLYVSSMAAPAAAARGRCHLRS